jgi:hypothetical protein
MASSNMRATLVAYLILWLSFFDSIGVYAKTLKPLDKPITAVSSGEFGLDPGLSVHLHSYVASIGPEAEDIVRRAYRSEEFEARDEVADVNKRGLWSFLWSATKVFINPMSWTTYLSLFGLACDLVGFVWSSAPKGLNYACSAASILGGMWSAWTGRATIGDAWNAWSQENANRETLQMLPFYNNWGDVVDNSGRRSVQNITRGHEGGYYDWTVLHPYLANKTAQYAAWGNTSILHDVGRNYAIITMAHVINASSDKPLLVQRSLNGTLLGLPVSMFFNNGTGSSAGLVAHSAFGAPVNSSAVNATKRDDGDCDGWGNDSGTFYADNMPLCGGDGTQDPDGITGVYYGMDFYGTESQWEEFDSDVGGQYPTSNGAWDFAEDLSEDASNNAWWRACLCDQEGGDYSWTGALQFTWNGGYNGYNDCYSGTCGGAT